MTLMNTPLGKMENENKIDLKPDEEYVIIKIRESADFSTFRIEKRNGKLVFGVTENKWKVPIVKE